MYATGQKIEFQRRAVYDVFMSSKPIVKHPQYLTGKLLLAMPSIEDTRFARAVIFMCAHDDKGAMGFMVNHTMPDVGFDKIIEQTGLHSDIEIDVSQITVMNGGPVEESRGFLLHSTDFEEKDTIRIDRDYGVTGTIDALRSIVSGKGPDQMLFVLGHAGWSAGQLDKELQENSWLVVDPTPELIFDTPIENKWAAALRLLGIDPAMLSPTAGRA